MEKSDYSKLAFALVSVALGFVLSQLSEWVKSKRKEAKKRRSIRQLLKLEIDHNISLVSAYWKAVLAAESDWSVNRGINYSQFAEKVSSLPFPTISLAAWLANLADITSAYSECELATVWQLQQNMTRLAVLHEFFCDARVERTQASRHHSGMHGSAGIGAVIGRLGFSVTVEKPAIEFKALIENVVACVIL